MVTRIRFDAYLRPKHTFIWENMNFNVFSSHVQWYLHCNRDLDLYENVITCNL